MSPPQPSIFAGQTGLSSDDDLKTDEVSVVPVRLDVGAILGRLGYDRELFNDLIDIYVSDIDLLISSLSAAVARHARDESIRAAHSIKGLASNFGLTRVLSGAMRIEKLAFTGEWPQIPSHLEQLKRDANALKEALGVLKQTSGS